MRWNRTQSCRIEDNHVPCSSGEDLATPALGWKCNQACVMPEGSVGEYHARGSHLEVCHIQKLSCWGPLRSNVTRQQPADSSQNWHTSCEARVKNNVLLIVEKYFLTWKWYDIWIYVPISERYNDLCPRWLIYVWRWVDECVRGWVLQRI